MNHSLFDFALCLCVVFAYAVGYTCGFNQSGAENYQKGYKDSLDDAVTREKICNEPSAAAKAWCEGHAKGYKDGKIVGANEGYDKAYEAGYATGAADARP